MRKFVYDNIVADILWCEHEKAIKAKVALGCTASPEGLLTSDGKPRVSWRFLGPAYGKDIPDGELIADFGDGGAFV